MSPSPQSHPRFSPKTRRAVPLAICLALACGIFTGLSGNSLLACPFCGAASMTLAEQLSTADAAALVKWSSGQKEKGDDPGFTLYEIVKITKGAESFKKGEKIKILRYREAKPGDLFFVLGTKGEKIDWGSPLEVTETSFKYISEAPPTDSTAQKRLSYYLKYLENPDTTIANDAFAEFANAQYKDVAALKKEMSPEKLRSWIANKDVPQTRLGLYGMMLGLCGQEQDAKLLEKKITENTDEFRLGIDGIMGGYLLLTKDQGLSVIENSKFVDSKVPFSETFAAMQAIRFIWTYGDGTISPDRLRQSMRMLLERPELTDLVIADLARWKDWSIMSKLMGMYGQGAFDIPSIKRAIVRYMLVCSKDLPKEKDAKPGPHVALARKNLEELRAADQKTVSEAERFYISP